MHIFFVDTPRTKKMKFLNFLYSSWERMKVQKITSEKGIFRSAKGLTKLYCAIITNLTNVREKVPTQMDSI